jgi:hypothetical protein
MHVLHLGCDNFPRLLEQHLIRPGRILLLEDGCHFVVLPCENEMQSGQVEVFVGARIARLEAVAPLGCLLGLVAAVLELAVNGQQLAAVHRARGHQQAVGERAQLGHQLLVGSIHHRAVDERRHLVQLLSWPYFSVKRYKISNRVNCEKMNCYRVWATLQRAHHI